MDMQFKDNLFCLEVLSSNMFGRFQSFFSPLNIEKIILTIMLTCPN